MHYAAGAFIFVLLWLVIIMLAASVIHGGFRKR